MWAGIVGFVKGMLAALPALSSILAIFDKWFGKTPEEKGAEKRQDEIDKARDDAHKIGDAIKKAEKGDTGDLEDIINRK